MFECGLGECGECGVSDVVSLLFYRRLTAALSLSRCFVVAGVLSRLTGSERGREF